MENIENLERSMISETDNTPLFSFLLNGTDSGHSKKIADHRVWLNNIRHETPSTAYPFKIGVYIRFFNQTKHDNYLSYHKKQFIDSISLCPKWELVDFYIDEGSTAPHMENAGEWSRLLTDCMDGKVDLIITQKVSNVSNDVGEVSFCARILATQEHPIGIYFVSEDIFTLASYYKDDLRDTFFLPASAEKEIGESQEGIPNNDR